MLLLEKKRMPFFILFHTGIENFPKERKKNGILHYTFKEMYSITSTKNYNFYILKETFKDFLQSIN